MKNFLLASLLCTSAIYADPCEDCPETACFCGPNFSVDASVGYFYPFSSSLREVISGGLNYQLLLGYKFSPHFDVVLGGDFFYKEGHSTGTGSKTSLWILPLTLGLRASTDFWTSIDQMQIVRGYCLIGPRWYFVRGSNSTSYLKHHNYAQGAGGLGGVGIAYLYKQIEVKTFVNGSFGNVRANNSKKHVKAPNTQVGGLVVGAGLGFDF